MTINVIEMTMTTLFVKAQVSSNSYFSRVATAFTTNCKKTSSTFSFAELDLKSTAGVAKA